MWTQLQNELLKCREQGTETVQTHLFAVLTLLSKLRTVPEALSATAKQQLRVMTDSLHQLARSPILAVRKSAAQALASLLPPAEKQAACVQLLQQTFAPHHHCIASTAGPPAAAPASRFDHNWHHGAALCLEALLQDEGATTATTLDVTTLLSALASAVAHNGDSGGSGAGAAHWRAFARRLSPFALATCVDVVGQLWLLQASRVKAVSVAEGDSSHTQHLVFACKACVALASQAGRSAALGLDKLLSHVGGWMGRVFSTAHGLSLDGDLTPMLSHFDAHLGLMQALERSAQAPASSSLSSSSSSSSFSIRAQ